MKCMNCVFRKRRMKEYPCNACKEVVHDADRSYYVNRNETLSGKWSWSKNETTHDVSDGIGWENEDMR